LFWAYVRANFFPKAIQRAPGDFDDFVWVDVLPWLLNFVQKINFFPGVDGHYYLFYFVLITKSATPALMPWDH